MATTDAQLVVDEAVLAQVLPSAWRLQHIERDRREMSVEMDGSDYPCHGCQIAEVEDPSGERPSVQLTFAYADWTWLFNLCALDAVCARLTVGMGLDDLGAQLGGRRS